MKITNIRDALEKKNAAAVLDRICENAEALRTTESIETANDCAGKIFNDLRNYITFANQKARKVNQ